MAVFDFNVFPPDQPTNAQDLGRILVEVGVITDDQLRQALQAAGSSSQELSKCLIDMGYTTEEKIMKGIGIKAKVPYFTTLEGLYAPGSANIISEELARRLRVVPLFKADNIVTVAMENPLDLYTIDTLAKSTGLRIDPVVCMRSTLFETINKLYSGYDANILEEMRATPRSAPSKMTSLANPSVKPVTASAKTVDFQELLKQIKDRMPENVVGDLDSNLKDLKKVSQDMPIVQLFNTILEKAVTNRASDIHIEPCEDHTEIRNRVDGVLHSIMTIPKEFESSLVARIKVMANLDITETRQPQDGRVVTEIQNKPVDMRISTLPMIHGEKAVIRLLDRGSVDFNPKKIGFTEDAEKIFREALAHPYGIILLTGPTGSGKSTTLYCGLNILNSTERNIVTLEDPVEYQIAGINQVQLNPKVGLTFAKGLRSILRQDPNVVMVGEIRDEETAQIAIQAALTGHLVLSTLHTNDAPAAITRLINMGVEPFLIAASVLVVIAQRLIRLLCPDCKASFQPPAAILDRLRKVGGTSLSGATFYQARGCGNCSQIGYKGRRAIHEIVRMSTGLRELTTRSATLLEIRDLAKKEGMRTLFEEGLASVTAGETTIEELLRVCTLDQ